MNEQRLRDSLHERAQDIQTIPTLRVSDRADHRDQLIDFDDLEVRRTAATRPWVVLAAAAAVIAAVAGIVVAIGRSGDGRAPAITGPPSVLRSACQTTIPDSWRTAARAHTETVQDATIVGVTSDGTPIGTYQETVDGREVRSVGAVSPGPRTPPIWSARASRVDAFDVDVDERTVLVTTEVRAGRTTSPSLIVSVDLGTGDQTFVAASADYPRSHLVGPGYVQNGVAYWATVAADGGTYRVYAEKLGPGARARVVASGDALLLRKSALGISWTIGGPVDRPADVPSVVAGTATPDLFDSYVTDGNAYAWETSRGDLEWYDRNARRAVRVVDVLGPPTAGPSPGRIFAVAGPLVYYQDSTTQRRVLDTRTGATAGADAGSFVGSYGSLITEPSVLQATSAGGNLVRIGASQLPALTC